MSEARGLGRDAFIYALTSILNAAAGFGSMYIFSRLLSPSEYGYYFAVLAGVEITAQLSTAWVNLTTIRLYASFGAGERRFFLGRVVASYAISFAILLFIALILSALTGVIGWHSASPWLIFALVIVISAYSFLQALQRTQRKAVDWMATALIMTWGRLLLGWWFLTHVSASGMALLAVHSGAHLLAVAFAAVRVKEPIKILRSHFRWAEIKPILSYGGPVALVASGGWLMRSASKLIMTAIAGTAAVGIFEVSFRLCETLIQIPLLPFNQASEPVTFRLYEHEGANSAREYLSKYFTLILYLGTGITLALVLLRNEVVGTLLAPEYATAASLIPMLGPTVALVALHPTLSRSFQFPKKPAMLSVYTLGAGGINVALNFFLIPRYAEYGAAAAAIFTYSIYVFSTYLGGQKLFQWRPALSNLLILPIPVAALLLANSVLPAPHGFAVTLVYGIGYFVFYLAVTFVCWRLGGKPQRQQLSFLRQIFASRTAPAGQ